jgi:hypothetical protein
MARFRFRLQPVLDRAAVEEAAARQAFLVVAEAVARAFEDLRLHKERIEADRVPLELEELASAAWPALGDERRAALDRSRATVGELIAAGERELSRLRPRYEAAVRRRAALERLCEGRRSSFARARMLAQAREIEEANVQRSVALHRA